MPRHDPEQRQRGGHHSSEVADGSGIFVAVFLILDSKVASSITPVSINFFSAAFTSSDLLALAAQPGLAKYHPAHRAAVVVEPSE